MQDIARGARRQPGAPALLLPDEGPSRRGRVPAHRGAAVSAGRPGDGVRHAARGESRPGRARSRSITCRGRPDCPATSSASCTIIPSACASSIAALTGATPEDVRPRVAAQGAAADRRGRPRRQDAPIAPEQFLVNLLSLCVFPFAARPILMVLLGLDDQAFDRFIKNRRDELAGFFLRAISA